MRPFRNTASVTEHIDVRRDSRTSSLRAFGALILAGALLTTPAILNGFPFIFYDSASYLKRASAVTHNRMNEIGSSISTGSRVEKPSPPLEVNSRPARGDTSYKNISRNPFFLRPITYSIILIPFSTPLTFYLLPLAQGILSAYVIRRLLCLLGLTGWGQFFATVAGLATLSSLPIQVSYVMPDIFTGILVVMSFITVYSWSTRSNTQRVFDAVLMTGLIAVHLSHIPIALALMALFGLLSFKPSWGVRLAALVGGVAMPFALAISLLVGSNYIAAKHPVISESSPIFLLARLVGDGTAVTYLREHCSAERYLLCDRLDDLGVKNTQGSVSDHFLWDPTGSVKQAASPRLLTEAAKINSGVIREFPFQVMGGAMRNGFRQLLTFQVDVDINSWAAPFVVESIRQIGPDLVQPYVSSVQARGAFPLRVARMVIGLGLTLALASIAYVMLRRRSAVSERTWLFLAVVITGLAANALATGGLSEVHDRYGDRVIWLVPLAGLVLLCAAATARPANTKAD